MNARRRTFITRRFELSVSFVNNCLCRWFGMPLPGHGMLLLARESPVVCAHPTCVGQNFHTRLVIVVLVLWLAMFFEYGTLVAW